MHKDQKRDIVFMSDPSLSRKAQPVDAITDEVKDLAKDMLDMMYAARGCGLAAPQVGEQIRLIVVDVDWDPNNKKKKRNPYVLINPEIVELSDETHASSEGCLSFPGVTTEVMRANKIVVEAEALDGDRYAYSAEQSLLCDCLQHEIDHLNGITLIDHMSVAERAVAKKTVQDKIAQAHNQGKTPWEVD